MSEEWYRKKALKYKMKYNNLKNRFNNRQSGGNDEEIDAMLIELSKKHYKLKFGNVKELLKNEIKKAVSDITAIDGTGTIVINEMLKQYKKFIDDLTDEINSNSDAIFKNVGRDMIDLRLLFKKFLEIFRLKYGNQQLIDDEKARIISELITEILKHVKYNKKHDTAKSLFSEKFNNTYNDQYFIRNPDDNRLKEVLSYIVNDMTLKFFRIKQRYLTEPKDGDTYESYEQEIDKLFDFLSNEIDTHKEDLQYIANTYCISCRRAH